MRSARRTGFNLTGIDSAPIDGRAMSQQAGKAARPPEPDGVGIGRLREDYATEADPVGTSAPPPSVRGVSSADEPQKQAPAVLLDKLAERLAFERSCTRLYEALLAKLEANSSWPNGPTRAALLQYLHEELAHFRLLVQSIVSLGGDATMQSPSADLAAVETAGILQVLTDPRTDMPQCLHAMLAAELVDNEGWSMLIELVVDLERDEFVVDFRKALSEEENHLLHIRKWLSEHTLIEAEHVLETTPRA
jgi:hypothetical protein